MSSGRRSPNEKKPVRSGWLKYWKSSAVNCWNKHSKRKYGRQCGKKKKKTGIQQSAGRQIPFFLLTRHSSLNTESPCRDGAFFQDHQEYFSPHNFS